MISLIFKLFMSILYLFIIIIIVYFVFSLSDIVKILVIKNVFYFDIIK